MRDILLQCSGVAAIMVALIHGVLGEGRSHQFGSALLAIGGALFFGLGFGRVLQLAPRGKRRRIARRVPE